jgi:starch phosphorylase
VAGLRLARSANAVSQLHAETARAMWAYVSDAAPIVGITNGVHAPTWQAHAIREADGDAAALAEAHDELKRQLVAQVEEREGVRLDPSHLLIGFARRAASYKRSDLILRDDDALDRLLDTHPVTLVFAGKAHPDDKVGKSIIARLVEAQHRWPGRVVFVENYDMALGRVLTRGCDVWLNNPVRPLEASGTSGMKAALNGVLNLSILDGWWPEGCEHGVDGWAITSERPGDDAADLAALHRILRDEVLPAWGDRPRWQRMMQASITMATTRFTSDRMVGEYFARLYPLATPAPATSV